MALYLIGIMTVLRYLRRLAVSGLACRRRLTPLGLYCRGIRLHIIYSPRPFYRLFYNARK